MPYSQPTTEQENYSKETCCDERPAISGRPVVTLIGTVIIGMVGLGAAVLLTNTRNYLKPTAENVTHPTMPILQEKAASVVMAGAPNLVGSLMRIPFAVLLENFSTRILHVICMLVCLIGVIGLMVISFATQQFVELGTSIYAAYVILGIISGTGLAVFSLGITTVSFWSPHHKMGTMNGIYGGVTNLAPGIFGLWVAKTIVSTSLGVTYLIWANILLFAIVISVPMINNSPYHQLLFQKQKEAKKSGMPISKKEYEAMEEVCQREFGQDLFPKGSAKDSLVESAKDIRTWVLVYLYNVSFGGFLALTVYLPLYYKDAYGTPTSVSGYLGSTFSLIAAAVRVPGGFLSDMVKFTNGGVFVGILSNMCILVGSIIMVAFSDFGVNVFGSIVIAVGIGSANAAVYKILPKFSHSAVAGASGWVSGIGAFGGVIWPLVMSGIENSTGNIHMGFITFVAAAVIALLCLGWIMWRMMVDEKGTVSSPLTDIEMQNIRD